VYSIHLGNCQEVLKTLDENTLHSVITDPPYGMGMEHWDHSVPSVEIWREVYRVMRPGAFLLSFCSPELYHRMACNIEDAGFLIKDQIMWMTTTKMPKFNRLKPAHEPIAVAQKPLEGTIQNNFEKWGCGTIDIEAARIPWDKKPPTGWVKGGHKRRTFGKDGNTKGSKAVFGTEDANPNGRYPSNIVGEVLPEHQKYFYAPRATRAEKGEDNDHPTVKPVDLMAWLIKIYSPINTTVLDPFCGSGTTGVAAIQLGRDFLGIDMTEKYVNLSNQRCEQAEQLVQKELKKMLTDK
jgi:DNA modification methylase